ncbi:MAG TPA: CBS domain-containing protein [Planctomycetaceae bacterium]|jgi:CBS domain-containing protein
MSTLSEILREKAGFPLFSIDQGASVLDAVQMMNDCSVGALIVNHSGRMSGIFTERDVLRRVLGKRLDPAATPISQVLTEKVICCTPGTSIEEARELMRSRRIRHLPVLDAEGEVVGVISIGDLNAHLATHQEVEIHYLQEYLHGRV